MTNCIILIITIINAIIFFTSFLGKSHNSKIKKVFYILYVVNAISVLSFSLVINNFKYSSYLNIITQVTFQITLLLILKLTVLYINKKNKKFKNIFYLIPAIFGILFIISDTTSLIPLKLVSILFEITNFLILIHSFTLILTTLLNSIHYFNISNATYALTMLFSIILSPAIMMASYSNCIYVQPLILSILFYILYITIICNENIDNIPISLANEFNLIPSSVVLIDTKGTLLEYNKQHIKMFQKFAKDENLDFFNYFSFIKTILDTEGLNELKFYIRQVMQKKDTEYYVKRFLYNKKYYLYTIEIYPIFTKNALNFMLVLTEGEHVLLLDKKEDNILSSKFETLGELAESVITDINTPISSIKTNLSILKTDKQISKEDVEFIDMIDSSASKINILATSMKNHFRNSSHYKNESFDLSDILISIEALTKTEFKNANCTLTLDTPDSLIIYGIPSKLSQVLLNIINNSLKAYSTLNSKDSNKIIIKATSTQKNVIIYIKDFAGGISKEIQPHIFNNILTTKTTNGFGLGLYVSNNIIKEDFGGTISFSVKENNSTTFKITIPTSK